MQHTVHCCTLRSPAPHQCIPATPALPLPAAVTWAAHRVREYAAWCTSCKPPRSQQPLNHHQRQQGHGTRATCQPGWSQLHAQCCRQQAALRSPPGAQPRCPEPPLVAPPGTCPVQRGPCLTWPRRTAGGRSRALRWLWLWLWWGAGAGAAVSSSGVIAAGCSWVRHAPSADAGEKPVAGSVRRSAGCAFQDGAHKQHTGV